MINSAIQLSFPEITYTRLRILVRLSPSLARDERKFSALMCEQKYEDSRCVASEDLSNFLFLKSMISGV